jgi:AraC-like DNA-binding protein
MHRDPGHSWHLEDLAKATAMSRTTFAMYFRKVAGVGPLTYLTEWRMRLAEHALREDRISVSELAQSLGYTSESAFSHAFSESRGWLPGTIGSQKYKRCKLGNRVERSYSIKEWLHIA